MNKYEYKIVDMPKLISRKRSVNGLAALEHLMNDFGSNGWEFVRQEHFTVTEKRFLRANRDTEQAKLVFRRFIARVEERGEIARLVLTDPVEPQKVAPRRIRNPEMVSRIKAGSRRITVVDAVESMAAQESRARQG